MNRQEDEALRVRMGDENLARAQGACVICRDPEAPFRTIVDAACEPVIAAMHEWLRQREPHEMGEWREVQMMWRWSAAGDSLDTKIVYRWRWP